MQSYRAQPTGNNVIRNYLNEQINNSFVENILNPENIQLHGNLDVYAQQNNMQTNNNTNSNALVTTSNRNNDLDEFKNKVKIWIRLDNEVRELSSKIKVLDNERKQRKKYLQSLTPFILNFMNSQEIEEINSRDGKLKYNTSIVKTPLTQKNIREQLYSSLNNETHEVLDNIFKNRQKIEKITLRRIEN